MNKTAALKIAKANVRMYRSGTGWVLITPHDVNDLSGIARESHQMDYHTALFQRTQSVCWLAMRLMGYTDDADIYWALDNGHTTMAEMLDDALGKLRKVAA